MNSNLVKLSTSREAQITLKGLKKYFGSHFLAVDIQDLTIHSGEILTLLGPSGCGKSTTLRLIAGLEYPDEGDILFDGISVLNVSPSNRDVAMVFQNYALYPHLSVLGNMEYGLKKRRIPQTERTRLVGLSAELLEITSLLKRKPRELSGGQQQRVALGRAMVRSPRYFLLDEPLSNLDARLRHQMRAEIITLHRKLKTTTVYVTHDQYEAMTMSDRIAVMLDGVILQCDTPKNIYRSPVNRFVGTFVGFPAMNILPGQVQRDIQGKLVFCCGGENGISIPLKSLKLSNQVSQISQEGDLGVRPEDVHIVNTEENTLKAEVKFIEFTGPDLIIRLNTSVGEIVSKMDVDSLLRTGDIVHLTFNFEKIHIFERESGLKVI